MPNFLSVLEGAKSQENHSSLLVNAVELLENQYWVTFVLRSLLGRPWAALLLLSLHQKGDLLHFLLLGPRHLGLS